MSHDIIAHQTSHAILDGLRGGLLEPGLPDQAAFHEALADIVAILSVFSIDGIVSYALDPERTHPRIANDRLEIKQLGANVLFRVAEQMGRALSANRVQSLRDSLKLDPPPGDWVDDPRWDEPHDRGELLVAAVLRTLVDIWYRRLRPMFSGQGVDRERAAEEGAKAAGHLLHMVIRAIDYTPAGEFEFSDFLDALLTADKEVVPDDRHGYRKSLLTTFQAFGINLPPLRIVNLALAPQRPVYDNFNYEALRGQREEIFRFIWENADLFELPTRYYTVVDDVQPSVRVGPDGFVVREVVVTCSQLLEGPASEMEKVAKANPGRGTLVLHDGVDRSTPIRIRGAGMIIFDQFGRPKYHQPKHLLDWDRQSRRLRYLVRQGRSDTSGRYGYSEGAPSGQRFADAHRPDRLRSERW